MNISKALTNSIKGDGGTIPKKDITTGTTTTTTNKGFNDMLWDYIKGVNEIQQQADIMAKRLATGESTNIHETMISISNADISFRLLMQIRNKIVEAYQEIFRMQI